MEEDDYDTLDDIDSDKNIVRTKARLVSPFNTNRKWPFYLMAVGDNVLSSFQKFLCVSDLARKDKRILSKKYQIYFW